MSESARFPQWSDKMVSEQLPQLRIVGETEKVEFKEDFPDQAHKLAKELAALGTSGEGSLFIGINDNGDLVGVDADNGWKRDALVERMHGIVQKVKPPLDAEICFGVENGFAVLCVKIGPQNHPVFYYEGVPYIRDRRHSRPAEPTEVQDRIWSHPSSAFKRELERLELEQRRYELEAQQQHEADLRAILRR